MTMSSETAAEGHGGPSVSKRDFLFLMTGSLAAVGTAATIWPFIDQMNPDAATIAAAGPVDIDIQQLQPGQRVVALWAARPVFVVKRDQPALDELKNQKLLDGLRDPNSQEAQQPAYAANWSRSIKPEILVLVGVCTHLGCIPLFDPAPNATDPAPDWPGGFFAPATGRNTISPAGCSRAFPRPTISPFHPIIFPTTRQSGSAKIRRGRISTSIRSCRSDRPKKRPAPGSGSRGRKSCDRFLECAVAAGRSSVQFIGSNRSRAMRMTPYLYFKGACENALAFYTDCGLGKVMDLRRYAGTPMEGRDGGAWRDKVLHSLFEGDGVRFFASDGPDTEPMKGSALMIEAKHAGDAASLFARLSDGGRVTFPFGKQFWGDLYGNFTDRFGVQWAIIVPPNG